MITGYARKIAILALLAPAIAGCFLLGCSKSETKPAAVAPPAATVPMPDEVTAEKAKEILDSSDDAIYLDVRTVAEFEQGHPPRAFNIPVLNKNESTQQMEPNPEFLAVVQKAIAKDIPIIAGCRSGRRSGLARNMMKSVGYINVTNMLGGFSGKRDASGSTVHSGWSELGYAVQTDDGGDRSYAKLKENQTP